MNVIKKSILIIISVILIVVMFTSFAHTDKPIQSIEAKQEQMITPLNRVEYVPHKIKQLDVPYINQTEQYPNGCEAVSTVMALKYMGIEISVDTFIDKYLDMGDIPKPGQISPDPDKVYCGDPCSDKGWGCNSPVIVAALKKFINTDKYTIEHSYGKALEDLCYDYIDRDIPVIIWATVDMTDSSSSENYHTWKTEDGKDVLYNRKLHCMVLCGYDEDNYYFNDPMTSKLKAYPKAMSEKAYSILGMQSVVIIRN